LGSELAVAPLHLREGGSGFNLRAVDPDRAGKDEVVENEGVFDGALNLEDISEVGVVGVDNLNALSRSDSGVIGCYRVGLIHGCNARVRGR